MNDLIIHIPHASAHIPSRKGFQISDKHIQHEILKLTDWYTDDLFGYDKSYLDDGLKLHHVKAEWSRIFCDVERFADDNEEVMAQYGMGVLYETTDDGNIMRHVNPEFREKVLSEYYDPHHRKLEAIVDNHIQSYGNAKIIDAHSFPDNPLNRDLNQKQPRPDFNIGIDPFHTPKPWIDYSQEYFEYLGYSLGIDWPYSGTIVPLKHYKKVQNVQSIMLEINRKLYLKDSTSLKSENYPKIKEVVLDFLTGFTNI